jgi:hypothetical protein
VGDDEENVVQLGVAVVLEVTDVGADLLAQASQRLGRPIPLQVEKDAASGRQIDPTAVGRGDGPHVLAAGLSPLCPHVLFAVPDKQALVLTLSALRDHVDEKLIGLQVVGGMPAVVASVVAALDVVSGIVAVPVGEHPRPSG